MGKLNMKDWIGQTILNKKVISIPIMTHPGIELIGKTVHDAVRTDRCIMKQSKRSATNILLLPQRLSWI
jgi:hypothetical protein